MKRREMLTTFGAAALATVLPAASQAQVRYFDGTPSVEDLQRALTPDPAAMAPAGSAPAMPHPGAPASRQALERRGVPLPGHVAPPIQRMRVRTVGLMVNFAFNSIAITPDARDTLNVLGAAMHGLGQFRFLIEGHTDAVGSDGYNLTLSLRRAQAVVAFLVLSHRIEPQRLDAAGLGKRQPREPADPYAAVNRRVEISNIGYWQR